MYNITDRKIRELRSEVQKDNFVDQFKNTKYVIDNDRFIDFTSAENKTTPYKFNHC